jgi:protein arginine kinase activator
MAERPFECGHCKRPIQVIYKEIINDTITVTEMCEACPILQKRLYGEIPPTAREKQTEGETGLYCGSCRTPLESVKTGDVLGCPECYSVFSDTLFSGFSSEHAIPTQARKKGEKKKGIPLHVGKSPTTPISFPTSSQLTSLNEALNDALKKENYEQAAWIRDQIKALLEKMSHDEKPPPPQSPS